MSEYQCYQFDAINRALSTTQRKAVGKLSSHISVGHSSAVVEYHYSSFKHDPIKVLRQYFDLFTYESNWGTQRLAFRFDKAAINLETIATYEIGQSIQIIETDDQVIIDCYFEENWDTDARYDYYDDCPYTGSRFTDFYEELLEDDLRSLHILWLKAAEAYDELENEPSIPAGLAQLDDTHLDLVNFIGLDHDLLYTAQSLSKPKRKRESSQSDELEALLPKLTAQEAQHLLRNLLKKNPQSARAELVTELRRKTKKQKRTEHHPLTATPPFSQLQKQAQSAKAERERLAELERQKQERLYFAKLQSNRALMWAKAAEFIERKKTKYYEYAIHTLNALKQLATHENNIETYYERANQLASNYPTLTGLQQRLAIADVISNGDLPDTPGYACRRESWKSKHPPEKEFPFQLLSE
ncbi:hypothetical protein [Pelagicoccus mobilis]|uniref:Uncharacterized protein n=1 Tax=Pelagicoccus mobilis TaxID=415221 RepID=A0A934S3Y0_9BACT|nr:hypothetical protein [Pelagicoccus mobilis]MBK1880246.1 hypothetical protein [Pelagicoccus mobilis]